ncbi:MAG: hypothetical protein HOB26_00775 [Flavobacteriales bacterium]|nr:hypothetical protein [Flavobacteriales bacterium]
MLKGLILFSNLILALIMNVIFGEGVKVTQNTPNQIEPGGEFVVEIVIDKTDVTGFAKIVQELPEGFMAEAIETQGASFTYNDNKVKLIWMALPQANEFTIKYKVTVGSEVAGEQIVSGKFSYLYNNERKTVDIPNNKILVGTEQVVESIPAEIVPETITETPVEPETITETPVESETITETPVEPETITETPVESETITETPVESETITETPVEPETITETPVEPETTSTELEVEQAPKTTSEPIVLGERKVKDMGDGTFKIEISITQNGIEGFAKAQEQLPAGITEVKGGETNNAVFSYVDSQAKFVWMSVPKDNPIYITYTVTSSVINAEQLRNMDGAFAYLHNEETKKAKITPSSNQPEAAKLIVENYTEITANKVQNNLPNLMEPTPIVEATIEQTPSIPFPENGVTYKVQICAGHIPVEPDSYFKRAFSFSEGPIILENHDGWIKYTIGGFDTYKTARNRRNVVTAGYELPGPFVSAYNDGTRITVQEALMISNQKWIQ